MSSVHRENGKANWYCHYSDHKGNRRNKSTLTTNLREANRICNELQMTEDLAKSGTLTPDKAREVVESTVSEIMASLGSPLETGTVREFFTRWLASRERETSQGTATRYKGVAVAFLKHLGTKADRSLNLIRPLDIESFRDKQAENVSATTCNMSLKILRVAFGKATKQGHFNQNPAQQVEPMSSRGQQKRRGFTDDEARKIFAAATGQWRTAIMLAMYTGMRLGDVSNLTWRNVDFVRGEITVQTAKTGRIQITPLFHALKAELESLLRPTDLSESILPDMAGKGSSSLSGQFYNIMVSAGLMPARGNHIKRKTGRDAKRTMNELGFHSYRHMFTTSLKNAGVSDSITMDMVGHDSPEISKNYTHVSQEAKRTALNKLPDLTKA